MPRSLQNASGPRFQAVKILFGRRRNTLKRTIRRQQDTANPPQSRSILHVLFGGTCAANRLWKLSPPAPRGQLLSARPPATPLYQRPRCRPPTDIDQPRRQPWLRSANTIRPPTTSPKYDLPECRRTGSPAGPSLLFIGPIMKNVSRGARFGVH
jgi:hypothetical protein